MFLILITASWTAFSQTGTQDTNRLCLPVPVLKEVAKDLIRKDSLEEENKLLWKNSDILSNQIRLKDALIANKDSLISIKNSLLESKDTIIAYKDRQFIAQKELSDSLEKALKKQKRRYFWGNMSSGAIIVTLIAFLTLK